MVKEKLNDAHQHSVDYVGKILKNIKHMANIEKVKVPKPDSFGMELMTISEYCTYLRNRSQIYGTYKCDTEIFNIIQFLKNHNFLMSERIEDAIRMTLVVIEEQLKLIGELKQGEDASQDDDEDSVEKLEDAKTKPIDTKVEIIDKPTENFTMIDVIRFYEILVDRLTIKENDKTIKAAERGLIAISRTKLRHFNKDLEQEKKEINGRR